MPIPTDRPTFINYCKRKLGWPTIQINIDPDQIEDRVDDAFQYWRDYHYDATQIEYFSYQLTQADLDNGYIPIDDDIIAVHAVLPYRGIRAIQGSSVDLLNNVNIQITQSHMLGNTRSINRGCFLTSWGIIQESLSSLDHMFQREVSFDYKRHTDQLHIHADWNTALSGVEYLVMRGERIIDENTYIQVWNDRWLKEYAVALLHRQWAQNLSKYEQVQLPGGITVNAETMWNRAETEIRRLEDEMQLRYEEPPIIEIG